MLGNVTLAANPANLVSISGVILVVAWMISTFLLVAAAFQNDKSMFIIPWLVIDPLVSICEFGMFVFVGIDIMKADQKRIGRGADYILTGVTILGKYVIFYLIELHRCSILFILFFGNLSCICSSISCTVKFFEFLIIILLLQESICTFGLWCFGFIEDFDRVVTLIWGYQRDRGAIPKGNLNCVRK